MPPVRFKSTVSAGERPQTYALDRKATGTSSFSLLLSLKTSTNMIDIWKKYVMMIILKKTTNANPAHVEEMILETRPFTI